MPPRATVSSDRPWAALSIEPVRVEIYDPDDDWNDWVRKEHRLETDVLTEQRLGAEVSCLARRVVSSRPRAMDLLVVVVPADGFDRAQAGRVRAALAEYEPFAFFVARIDENLLHAYGRNPPGFRTLRSEIHRTFFDGSKGGLATILADPEGKNVARMRSYVLKTAYALGRVRLLERCAARLHHHAQDLLQELPSRPVTLGACRLLIDRRERARLLGELGGRLNGDRKAAAASLTKLRSNWAGFCTSMYSQCAKQSQAGRSSGASAAYIADLLVEASEEVERSLASWHDVPACMKPWRDSAKEAASERGTKLPVVGRFSSGKTTLFNDILGPTRKGHARLRTANTHNTAVLLQFEPVVKGERQRVELRWREGLKDLDLLNFHSMDPVVLSPCAGTISNITDLEFGTLVTIDEGRNRPRTVLIEGKSPLLGSIRPGTRVTKEAPLTSGESKELLHKRLLSHDQARRVPFEIRREAIEAALNFSREGLLREARLDVLLRVPSARGAVRGPARLEPRSYRGDDPQFEDVLRRLLRDSVGKRYSLETLGARPVRVILSGPVRTPDRKSHDLENDTDWDWFQGEVASTHTQRRDRRGFAESEEAAYLLERAVLYLDNQLFRYLRMVDSPGLGSITRAHEQITEQQIKQSDHFIVMVKLAQADTAIATVRVLQTIQLELERRRVMGENRRDRVFLVLNWFRARSPSPDRASQRVREFRKLASRILGVAEPRVYVVDLDPKADKDELLGERTLLGLPSLAMLLEDLGCVAGGRGLAARTRRLRIGLEDTWHGGRKSLSDRAEGLRTGMRRERIDELTRLERRLARGGSLRRELVTTIQGTTGSLLRQLTAIEDQLDQSWTNKEEFEELSTFLAQAMRGYNVTRAELLNGVKGDELDAALPSLVRGVNSKLRRTLQRADLAPPPPVALDVDPATIEALEEDAAQRQLEEIAASWPSWLRRAWKWVSRLGESHGESESRRLRDTFVSEARRERIRRGVAWLEARLVAQTEQRTEDARLAIWQQLQDDKRSDEKKRSELEGLEAELQQLDAFEGQYERTRETLVAVEQRLRDAIEGRQT